MLFIPTLPFPPTDPFLPDDEPAPISQTPVVFETSPSSEREAPSSERGTQSSDRRSRATHAPSRRPSIASRLAPVALLPVFAGAIAFVMGSAPGAPAAVTTGASWARLETHAAPAKTDDLEMLETLTPCPEGMALVEQGGVRVCVDRWEASLVQVLPNGEEKAQSPYYTPMTWAGQKVKAVSRPGVVPQAYVSRTQASMACKAAGKRLCTGAEWRTACEGTAKTTYPYGDKHQKNACNTKGRNPMSMLVGGGKHYLWGSAMHHPLLNTYPQTLARTGAYAQCTNDYGLYDMVGNLHEWTADGAFRGGYYRDESVNGPGCHYQTTAHGPSYSDYSTGFRCCADPE